MSDVKWDRVETIIDEVLKLPKTRHDDFIDQKCQGNKKLKSEVTELLESIFDSEGWLEDRADYEEGLYEEISGDIELLSSPKSLIDKQLGSYTIQQQIGEGGMGAVYLAQHSDADLKHKVAIKIIRSSKATAENIQRFKQEQQILAGLQHPGIAQMYDAGIMENGSPYIIMEYVDGTPLIDYTQSKSCSLSKKLELFKQVLQAVQYAHENLVIHRDLKPANILVNNSGNIKILDFGISKLLEDDEDHSLTQTGVRLLTPRYAAPEQVRQENITTATDLYSLGIVFYQLLTGSTPFDFTDLSRYEMEQAILKQEAVKPSATVSDPTLKRELRGDLDAIALKAIRKEKDLRYGVSSEFMEDLNSYKKGVPVSAVGDSFSYRGKKFFKRNKQKVIAAAALLLLFIGLTGFYTWRVVQERNIAQSEAERANQIKDFTFRILGSADPDFSGNIPKDISATTLLKSGITTIDQELQNRPNIYVELMTSIGHSLQGFGEREAAVTALEKALKKSKSIPNNNLQTANVLMSLANTHNTVGNTEEAKSLIQESTSIVHDKTPAALRQLAHNYSKLGHSNALEGDYKLAKANYIKSDSLYLEAGSNQDHARYGNIKSLAEVQMRLEEYDDAEKGLLDILSFYQSYYDRTSENVAKAQSILGRFYSRMGQYNKANNYLNKALESSKKLWGEETPNMAGIYTNLALNYRETGDLDKALYAIKKHMDLVENSTEKNSQSYAISLNNQAMIQADRGEFQQAKANYKQGIAIKENILSPNHPSLAIAYYNYGYFLYKQKEYQKAIPYYEKAIAIDKDAYGKMSVSVAVDNTKLAISLVETQAFTRADSLFSSAQKILQQKLPKNHKRIAENLTGQGKLFMAQRRFGPAKNNFKQASAAYKSKFGVTDHRFVEADSLLNVSIQKLN